MLGLLGLLKRLIVGYALETKEQAEQKLIKRIALAVFSSDALSSVAYATEAILAVLILAGSRAMGFSIPVSIGISMLMFIVGFSYRQTIFAYPDGGGAYIVAHENLNQWAGLVAAAALTIDYVLTVAVSASAGVAAVVSLGDTIGWAWPGEHRVALALGAIAVITIMNLRGIKESGKWFAIPTYCFVVSMLALIGVGMAKVAIGGFVAIEPQVVGEQSMEIGLFLLLQAFSAGCTALTGVEAISNAVPNFKNPESKNAAATLMWMVAILGTMFIGISVLSHYAGATPIEGGETVLSQNARFVFGTGPVYWVIQVSTAVILFLAANTSFNGDPQLMSILARDRYVPRQFADRGDRLVYSNGVIVLGVFAAALVYGFQAREQAMLPMYAIGVFISFSLSQYGMVRYWYLHRDEVLEDFRIPFTNFRIPQWIVNATINAVGGTLTSIVFIVIIVTRFTHGGWAVLVAIPVLVFIFWRINVHYTSISNQLSTSEMTVIPIAPVTYKAVVLLPSIRKDVIAALEMAVTLAQGERAVALHVNIDDVQAKKVEERWPKVRGNIDLIIRQSPFRSLVRPIFQFLDEISNGEPLVVILPEFVPEKKRFALLHNQTGLILKGLLLFRRNTIVISVPYHLGNGGE